MSARVPTAGASGFQSDADIERLVEGGLVRLGDIEAGALLLHTDEPGWYLPAPTIETDVAITVSGPIARSVVTQRFRNIADVFVEAKYVFPLDEGASVDTLRMQVGDRWIEGQIEGREAAREIYEQARDAGQVASLVEQFRPNVFSTSVANVAPGAEVVVQIEHQQTLAPRSGTFGLRVPLVVAPRYTPGGQSDLIHRLTSRGWVAEPSPFNDPIDLHTPLLRPGGDRDNPVTISVDLDAGFPLGPLQSEYHDVEVDRTSENTARMTLAGEVPANRDFYLWWKPAELNQPYATGFTETVGTDTHHVAILTPPTMLTGSSRVGEREVIFVQDTSGSMQGASIEQARAGLVLALERLNPRDTFNIFEFDTTFTQFERRPIAATAENVARAVRWVNGLQADNGTEMLPALRAALANRAADDRLSQVVFLTDGAVTNEIQMLDLINQELDDSRMFTVGIGSAPNSYFMTAAARAGRGTFSFIGDLNEVEERMRELFERIEAPAVVDLRLVGAPAGAQVSPSPLPDLYIGDPIVVTVRLPAATSAESLQLVGTQAGQEWVTTVPLDAETQRPGVSKLWARERVRDLEAQRLAPGAWEARDEIDAEILATALEFGLVSRLTSLVAVDVEVTRGSSEDLASGDVPTALPEGWDPAVFGLGQSGDDLATGDAAASSAAAGAVSETAADLLRQGGTAAPVAGATLATTGLDSTVLAIVAMAMLAAGSLCLVTAARLREVT